MTSQMSPKAKPISWALLQTQKRSTKLGSVSEDIDRVTRLVYDRVLTLREGSRVTNISFYGMMLEYRVTWGQDVDHGIVDGVHRKTAADGYGFYLGKSGKDACIAPYPGCATSRGLPEDGWVIKDMTDDEIVDAIRRSLMWDMV